MSENWPMSVIPIEYRLAGEDAGAKVWGRLGRLQIGRQPNTTDPSMVNRLPAFTQYLAPPRWGQDVCMSSLEGRETAPTVAERHPRHGVA